MATKIISCHLLILLTQSALSQVYEPCQTNEEIPCLDTCCFDSIKCQDDDLGPVYLGADSVTRFNMSDELGIHVSYRNYSVQMKRITRNLQPKEDAIRGYWYKNGEIPPGAQGEVAIDKRYDKNTECYVGKNTSSPVVATLYYNKVWLLVCGNQIRQLGYSYAMGQFSNYSVDEKELNIQYDRGKNCPNKYKPLCKNETLGELIDAFSLPDGEGGEIMVAYYGEAQIRQQGKYSREYKVVSFDGTNMGNPDKVEGQLSAIDIYEIEKDKETGKEIKAYGIYFTNSGEVCPFEHRVGDTKFSFESVEQRVKCRSLQSFLACPQAWCVEAFAGASVTTLDKEHVEQVHVILYKYLWVMEAKPLPMDVPLVKNAIRIHYLAHNCDYYYTSKERKQYFESKAFKCLKPDAEAAFPIQVNGTQYVYNVFAYGKQPWWQVAYNGKIEHIQGPDVRRRQLFDGLGLPDAAWFDKTTELLYLFFGQNYVAFRLQNQNVLKPSAWKWHQNGTTKDLGLVDPEGIPEQSIGAVISMNGTNYFFNDRFWFYEIREGQTMSTGTYRLVQNDFFRVKSQCYYNDLFTYEELMMKHGAKSPPKQSFEFTHGVYTQAYVEISDSGSATGWVIGIVGLGAVICFVGLTIIFIIGQQRDQKDIYQTKVVYRYEKSVPRQRSSLKFKRSTSGRSKQRAGSQMLSNSKVSSKLS